MPGSGRKLFIGPEACAPPPALEKIVGEKLEIPGERFDALRRVELAVAATGAVDFAPRLAGLVGLAVPAGATSGANIDLIPKARRQARAARRREPWLLATAACVALGLLAPVWHCHRVAARARNQAAAIEAKLKPMRALQSRMARNAAELDHAKQELRLLQGLAEARTHWVVFLAELQARLGDVRDVWLDKLAIGHADPAQPARLVISGRLLDREHPIARVSAASFQRVKRLLASFGDLPSVATVEKERFDNTQPGILRFDCELVMDEREPL